MGKKTEIGKMEAVIEAILFTMGESVELKKIAAAIEHDEATTRKIIHRLQDKYEAEDRGLRIIELEDSFQLCTKREMYDYLIRIAKQPKKCVLTDVLLETLSIIAYRQPVTKLEIEKIRGEKGVPNVIIKGTDEGSYENLIACLNEMQICDIGKYVIVAIEDFDKEMIEYYKTNGTNPAAGAATE